MLLGNSAHGSMHMGYIIHELVVVHFIAEYHVDDFAE